MAPIIVASSKTPLALPYLDDDMCTLLTEAEQCRVLLPVQVTPAVQLNHPALRLCRLSYQRVLGDRWWDSNITPFQHKMAS